MKEKMKNTIRRVLSVFAAIAMVLGVMGANVTPVMADDNVTVTIDPAPTEAGKPDGSTGNPTYNYWVMMWASLDTTVTPNRVSYYVDKQELATALDNLKVDNQDLFNVTPAGLQHWNVTINKKSSGEEFTGEEVANALNGITNKDTISEDHGTAIYGNDGKASFSLTNNAYVLVTSSLGSKLVADTYGHKDIKEKNTYPTSTKTQSTEENGTYTSDAISREVGKTVYYHVDITIPSNANKEIKVYDTITKGLTLNTSIKLSATYNTPLTSVTWENETDASDGSGKKTYTATIPSATVIALANAAKGANQGYTTLTLAYSATVNENAIDFDTTTHEQNTAHITYGDDFTTKDTSVDVYTYKFQLLKYDAAKLEAGSEATAATPLGGAVFELYRKDETTPIKLIPTDAQGKTTNAVNPTHFRVAKSDNENGAVSQFTTVDGAGNTLQISGLDKNTTYTLKEVKAPDGFNKLTEDVSIPTKTVEIGGVFAVENHSGSVLPSTGGIGTTIFYVIGGVVVAGAIVLLIARRRKNA